MLKVVESDQPAGLVVTVSSSDSVRYTRYMAAIGALQVPKGSAFTLHGSAYVHNNRNRAVVKVLENPAWHWLLFIDDDNPPAPGYAMRLLKHEVDIVGGLYLHRNFPYRPHVYTKSHDPNKPYENLSVDDIPEDKLMAVDAVATGGLLIRRKVLEQLGSQAFDYERTPDGSWLGEDLSFCQKAQAAGFIVHVDTGAVMEHLTSVSVAPVWQDGKCKPAIILDNGAAVTLTLE